MSAPSQPFQRLSEHQWALLQKALCEFESEWLQGRQPRIDSFLPHHPDERHAFLVELVHTDLELRLKAGEPVRVEAYLERFPELADKPEAVVDLIAAEYDLRRRLGGAVDGAEFLARFPERREELLRRFPDWQAAAASAETAVSATRPYDSLADEHSPWPPAPADPSWPRLEGYEILGELGRGGMGVVWKARQARLDRLVALKMITPGGHLHPESLERFLREARAVARLRHPNIVQIHEIGEVRAAAAGPTVPYFSLEFVDGGTLDRKLAGNPLSPRDAARLVETVARAVHVAHLHGIIHRDLKPANILLQKLETTIQKPETECAGRNFSFEFPVSHYLPKITDFGLAKQLDDDSGRTRTGAIMGTPSYMAPEQAAGRTHEIGPATDVYALGAILYETLTGRPPFRGPTVLDTLEQVRTQEPIPPRQLQPKIPRDLETVCLKALAKVPGHRYLSALALAEDIRHFLAGEAILARPDPLGRKLWRKVRRNPVKAAVAVALVTLGLAGYVFWHASDTSQKASTDRRVAELTSAFERGLESQDWGAAHAQRMEMLVGELERLSPEQSGAARQRLLQRYTDFLRETLRGKLDPEDLSRFQADLQWLEARDAQRAASLQQELSRRLRTWQALFSLESPFPKLPDVFDSGAVEAKNEVLVRRDAAKAKDTAIVLTRISQVGHVRLEAVFHGPFDTANEIGLVLNSHERNSYRFQLVSAYPLPANPELVVPNRPPATLETFVRDGRPLRLQIVRNGVLLREQQLKVPAGAIRLSAAREGDRLTFQVNDDAPLVFQDLFPLREPGVFGLLWPAKAAVRRLIAFHQPLPVAPSPLEQGDDQFARGQFAEALAHYQAQDANAAKAVLRQEARYKQGLCLLALKRPEEAAVLLESAALGPEDHWRMLAMFRLWLLHLQQERRTEADTVFEHLAVKYRFDQVAALVPGDVRQGILEHYHRQITDINLFRQDPDRIRTIERAIVVQRLIDDQRDPYWHFWGLSRAYRSAGDSERALGILRQMLEYYDKPRSDAGLNPSMVMEYGWLMRERGAAAQALPEIDRWLYAKPGVYRPGFTGLLLERARLHVALKEWDRAEADVEEFFRQQSKEPAEKINLNYWSGACLLQGFLRAQKGDTIGALDAWRQPFPNRYYPGGLTIIQITILRALSGELTEADAEELLSLLTHAADLANLKSSIGRLLPPHSLVSALQNSWQSQRGRELARKIAFQEVSHHDCYRLCAALVLMEWIRQETFSSPLSDEQDALLWQTVQDYLTAYQSGTVSHVHVLTLLVAWKGVTGFGGWATVASMLKPDLRGPTAYLFGHRLLLLKQPQDAENLFRVALKDAPAGSSLERLTQDELKRLKSK